MRFLKDFVTGILLPLRAVKLIATTPRLLLLSTLPLIASIVIYLILWNHVISPARDSLVAGAGNYIGGVLGVETLSELQPWIRFIVYWLVQILLWVALALTFSWATNIVALPLNDLLAKGTEQFTTPPIAIEMPFNLMHEIGILWIDLKKNLFSAFVLVGCLTVAWIPIMTPFVGIIAWLMLTFQYVSYPQTRRGIGVLSGLKFLCSHFFLCLGFGIVISIGFGVPILFIFIPPIAIVSGTLLFSRTQIPAK